MTHPIERLAAWTLAAKNLCFPIFCLGCGARLLSEENGYFCPTCWELAPRITPPLCPSCGRPHTAMVGLGNRRNFPCADCRETPLDSIGRIYGATLYEGAIADAIMAFKFHDKHRLAGPLGQLLREFAAEHLELESYELLVPVPLHRVRLRARGYNQSALLAAECLPVFPNARLCNDLERIRPTRTQSTLVGAKRAENVRGAFAIRGNGLEGRRALLIDDVVTSGGTVTECAKALKRAGVSQVDVLAVSLVAHHAKKR